jgi:hypothetical protein
LQCIRRTLGIELHRRDPPTGDLDHQLPDTVEVFLVNPILHVPVRCDQMQLDCGFLCPQRPDPRIELLRRHLIA